MKWEALSMPLDLDTHPTMEVIGKWIEPHRQLSVFVTKDAGRWHMSIAHPNRLPTWPEVYEARYHFIPDGVYMMMALPPKHIYVNVHPNCFHLLEAQECKTIWHMEQM